MRMAEWRAMDLTFRRRQWTDRLVRGFCVGATILALIPLALVLYWVGEKGISSISWEFFTEMPAPVGETGGGMKHALVGTGIVVGIACAIGIPIGILAGIYLAEFGDNKFGKAVRFCADVMSGVPSIAVGIFVYTLIVIKVRHFSAQAGGVALAIIMLPTIMRTTEEMLRMVPANLREAALALGAPKRRAIVRVALRTAAPGIMTGIMLAIARVAGETAPLLFTALGNSFYSTDLDKPIATMPVQIYTNAIMPYDNLNQQAWAAALVLVFLVMIFSLSARLIISRRGGVR